MRVFLRSASPPRLALLSSVLRPETSSRATALTAGRPEPRPGKRAVHLRTQSTRCLAGIRYRPRRCGFSRQPPANSRFRTPVTPASGPTGLAGLPGVAAAPLPGAADRVPVVGESRRGAGGKAGGTVGAPSPTGGGTPPPPLKAGAAGTGTGGRAAPLTPVAPPGTAELPAGCSRRPTAAPVGVGGAVGADRAAGGGTAARPPPRSAPGIGSSGPCDAERVLAGRVEAGPGVGDSGNAGRAEPIAPSCATPVWAAWAAGESTPLLLAGAGTLAAVRRAPSRASPTDGGADGEIIRLDAAAGAPGVRRSPSTDGTERSVKTSRAPPAAAGRPSPG